MAAPPAFRLLHVSILSILPVSPITIFPLTSMFARDTSMQNGLLEVDPSLYELCRWTKSERDDWDPSLVIFKTSMATHMSSVAALVKRAHSNWSLIMIKSMIMIIANSMNLVNNPIEDQTLQSTNIFAIGSDYVISLEVIDSGLVYDIQPEEYIRYLFGLNYTNQ
ncbi:subtilisin-like protease SBT1.1 [Olea europaea var. sylvestris]|uniref:subtilisin-like protease SBT1.1 n=1 Tax=Olea europaea var. sylvestris TaxID=158386 RepID=UPI000C1D26FE|nr:subtilisin-like protease SBT1.1 [Olea europaea var. sylvestris]